MLAFHVKDREKKHTQQKTVILFFLFFSLGSEFTQFVAVKRITDVYFYFTRRMSMCALCVWNIRNCVAFFTFSFVFFFLHLLIRAFLSISYARSQLPFELSSLHLIFVGLFIFMFPSHSHFYFIRRRANIEML